jgi:probable F420-dependent oxidoreductase
MEIGVAFPQVEIGTDPIVIRDFAQAVEGMGFKHLSCIDHILGARVPNDVPWSPNYTRDRQFHEPLVLFGFLAAVTRSIRMATAILILPQRQTALVAKQAAEVDVLSQGRLTLGMGIGWNEVEFVAQNETFKNRARRMEEQFEVLRMLWTNELVTFKGKYHEINDAGINPLPVQQPIPLWIGAFQDVAIQRACRIADGWFTRPWMRPDDEGKATLAQVDAWLAEHGRDRSTFAINAVTMAKNGSVNQWVDETEGWRNMGVSHCTFRTIDAPYETIDQHIAACRTYADAIGLKG